MMKELLINLQIIYVIAKHIHYNYVGINFLSIHKYMDEVADPIQDDFIDAIKEKFFMANGESIPSFPEIYQAVINYCTLHDNLFTVEDLLSEMRVALYRIDQLSRDSSLHAGTIDLLGKIASHFQTNIALLQHLG